MDQHRPLVLDMTPQGEFRPQPTAFRLTWPMKIALTALAVSFVAGVAVSFALLLYVAALLIPAALVLSALGYARSHRRR